MAQRTVPANELAIKALRCPDGRARVVYHVDGHGNEGLKLYVESSGTKTWYYRARVAGSATKDMPLGRWPDVAIAEARKLGERLRRNCRTAASCCHLSATRVSASTAFPLPPWRKIK
jgi:Arm DNA-binding domain